MKIYINEKIGQLTGAAVIKSDGLIEVEVDEFPSDFENFAWTGTELVRNKETTLESLKKQNATLMKQTVESAKQLDEMKNLVSQMAKKLAENGGESND